MIFQDFSTCLALMICGDGSNSSRGVSKDDEPLNHRKLGIQPEIPGIQPITIISCHKSLNGRRVAKYEKHLRPSFQPCAHDNFANVHSCHHDVFFLDIHVAKACAHIQTQTHRHRQFDITSTPLRHYFDITSTSLPVVLHVIVCPNHPMCTSTYIYTHTHIHTYTHIYIYIYIHLYIYI